MKKFTLLASAAAVVVFPAVAHAQSTGTVEAEKDAIVITGTRQAPGTAGVVLQDTTKAKGLVTQEFIAKQTPGQTVINAVNYVPSVNFTQSDPYGNSSSSLRIRGFDGARISVTFDGIPTNDSGNYALYTNQIIDPELVEQVNVNLGATDVDSPTASAAGGTVNYRSLIPTTGFGMRAVGSAGSFNFKRIFMMVNSGEFGPWGTRGWVSASRAVNDHWRGDGKIRKWQVNGKLYQPLAGSDFVSLAAHYNENRNNNFSNPSLGELTTILGSPTVPSTYTGDPIEVGDFTEDQWKRINSISYIDQCRNSTGLPIFRPTPGPGAQSDPSNCFDPDQPNAFNGSVTSGLRTQGIANLLSGQINPSNTGNIRAQSRFTLTDKLVLTVDPTYQYSLANGGSQTTRLSETDPLLQQGLAAGVDINGDGDFLDTVLVGRPSITNTRRITVLSSLVFKPFAGHTFRAAYTFDRAHHRQTGEYSYTNDDFTLTDPFFGRNGKPLLSAAGTPLQNRDRLSIAKLHQLSGQYIGRFIDDRLRVELGIRAPWFSRDLDQRCYTPAAGGGFPVCVDSAAVSTTGVTTGNYLVGNDYVPPAAGLKGTPVYAPFKAKYKFDKLLPNLGATFAIDESLSVFGSYAGGFSSPRTDNLYRKPVITIEPETTTSYDLGARFIRRNIQAQATAWKIDYENRIVSSFDPITNISVDRNVGKVKSWGVDGSIGFRPLPQFKLLALASYTNAKLKEDIVVGAVNYVPVAIPATADTVAINASTSTPAAATGETYYCEPLPTTFPTASGVYVYNVCGKTAGKFVAETPKWQFGGRVEFDFQPFTFGVQGKYVGKRYATDVNDVVAAGYTVVDLDARANLNFMPGRKSYLQVNVTNLLDEHYFGNISTQISAFGTGNNAGSLRFTPVAGRSISASLNFGL